MYTEYAEILHSLAEGVNPVTGEVLPDGVLDQPKVIRALFAAERALREKKQTDRARPENAGKLWSPEDDAMLRSLYGEGLSDGQIAQRMGRSKYSITLRLERMIFASSPEQREKAMRGYRISPKKQN